MVNTLNFQTGKPKNHEENQGIITLIGVFLFPIKSNSRSGVTKRRENEKNCHARDSRRDGVRRQEVFRHALILHAKERGTVFRVDRILEMEDLIDHTRL